MALTSDELRWATILAMTAPATRSKSVGRIKIVVPPRKLEYISGETIDLAGIRVVAYYTDGSLWGIVPFSELQFSPLTAEFVWHGVEYATPEKSIVIGQETISGPFYVKRISRIQYQIVSPTGHGLYKVSFTDPSPDAFGVRRDNEFAVVIDNYDAVTFQMVAVTDGDYILVASKQRFGVYYGEYSTTPDEYGYYHSGLSGTSGLSSFTYNGKTVYFKVFETSGYHPAMDESEQSFVNLFSEIAWYLCYGGDVIQKSTQIITVGWPRPRDGVLLVDTFDVTVVDEN